MLVIPTHTQTYKTLHYITSMNIPAGNDSILLLLFYSLGTCSSCRFLLDSSFVTFFLFFSSLFWFIEGFFLLDLLPCSCLRVRIVIKSVSHLVIVVSAAEAAAVFVVVSFYIFQNFLLTSSVCVRVCIRFIVSTFSNSSVFTDERITYILKKSSQAICYITFI